MGRRRSPESFDAVADLYDEFRPAPPPEVVAAVVEVSQVRPGSRVLEIGCGTGQLSVPLAVHGVDLTAIEVGPNLAARARRNLASFPNARVEVVVEPGPLGDDGADDVSYLLAANPGEPAKPLARAASGGELARAMLALRLVLTEAPPTLVFDEVDAGIGGEAGNAVGRLLGDLGARHQVLCVTHLAQVAAHADAQIVVEKREESGRTVASVTPIQAA